MVLLLLLVLVLGGGWVGWWGASAYASCLHRMTLAQYQIALAPVAKSRFPVVRAEPPFQASWPTTDNRPPTHLHNHPPPRTPGCRFHIHGGDFYQGYGGGTLYDGSTYASRHGIVVVSINYRLGALGFLYSGPDASTQFTGNFGLHDQRLAMVWTRDNIAAFGGDPNRVTLQGQSAGGMSVTSHLMMDASKGLFHAAIVQSEPFGMPFRSAACARAPFLASALSIRH